MPPDSPLVSVVLPVYNAANTLPICLDSLRIQTLKDIEIIAIDDGSSDDSALILQRAYESDSRIRVVRNAENLGLVTTLNRGIKACRGDLVARQDADDWSSDTRLQRQMEHLHRTQEVGFVGTAYSVVDADGSPLYTAQPPGREETLRRVLSRRNVLAHGSVMFRRDLFSQVGGYRPYFRMAQDYDLWLRMLEVSDPAVINETLYHLRISEASVGGSKKELQEAYSAVARRSSRLRASGAQDDLAGAGDSPPPSRTWMSSALVRAICLLKGRRRSDARRELLRCIRSDHIKARILAVGLLVIAIAPEGALTRVRELRWQWDSR